MVLSTFGGVIKVHNPINRETHRRAVVAVVVAVAGAAVVVAVVAPWRW